MENSFNTSFAWVINLQVVGMQYCWGRHHKDLPLIHHGPGRWIFHWSLLVLLFSSITLGLIYYNSGAGELESRLAFCSLAKSPSLGHWLQSVRKREAPRGFLIQVNWRDSTNPSDHMYRGSHSYNNLCYSKISSMCVYYLDKQLTLHHLISL